VLLLVAGLLAGCAQPRESPVAPAAYAPPGEERPPEPAPAPEDATATPLPRWVGEYKVALKVAACVDAADVCPTSSTRVQTPIFRLDLNESDPRVAAATHYAFRAEWTPTTDGAKVVRFHLMADDHAADLGKGTSPFLVEIPKDALRAGESYQVRVLPDGPGAFVDQSVRVALDLVQK